MIAASGILVIVAFVTLIAGVFRTGLELIWASIAASVLAALFLALGVVQGNKRRIVPATGGAAMAAGGGAAAPWSDSTATTAVMERGAVVSQEEEEEEEERPTLTALPAYEEPKPATRSAKAAPTPASKAAPKAPKTAAKTAAKSAAKTTAKAAPKKRAASVPMVVVVPDRDKYHRESCRYANNPAAIELTKAQARRQGYEPCATCKP